RLRLVTAARAHSFDCRFDRNIEEKRQVGSQAAGRKLDNLIDRRLGKSAADALIGEGGIGVTVGYDDAAVGKCGFYEKFDMLCTIGGEQQKFRHRSNVFLRLEERFAQAAAQRSPARLARRD